MRSHYLETSEIFEAPSVPSSSVIRRGVILMETCILKASLVKKFSMPACLDEVMAPIDPGARYFRSNFALFNAEKSDIGHRHRGSFRDC